MSKFNSPLNNMNVASPCPADWDEMYGDERKRFCAHCKLNVYNLSGMTRNEAERLVMNAEGRLCVRFYRRRDGTVLTSDCPVGWARVKHRARVIATAAFSLVMTLLSGIFVVSLVGRGREAVVGKMGQIEPPVQRTMGVVARVPGVVKVDDDRAVMGEMPIMRDLPRKRS